MRDRRGLAGWLALLYGAIACHWLNGPVARHLGPSELGAGLDLEADSWLTVCAALAGIACGDLPQIVLAAPPLRYAVLMRAVRRAAYREFRDAEPGWNRPLGLVQMLVFIAALALFRGRITSPLVRAIAPVQALAQSAGWVVRWRRQTYP